MSKPSQGQVLNAIAILMNNADWDAVSSPILQRVIDNPREVGGQFTAFLQNGGRVIVGEAKCISVDRTIPFDPSSFIGAGWSIAEEDRRSLDLSVLDLTRVQFETMLRKGENLINGEEKLKRLIASGAIRLDAKVLQTLWENKHLIPESWKQQTNGNPTLIFFDGTILRGPNGRRCVLYLYWGDGGWHWGYRWLGRGWSASRPSAVLAS